MNYCPHLLHSGCSLLLFHIFYFWCLTFHLAQMVYIKNPGLELHGLSLTCVAYPSVWTGLQKSFCLGYKSSSSSPPFLHKVSWNVGYEIVRYSACGCMDVGVFRTSKGIVGQSYYTQTCVHMGVQYIYMRGRKSKKEKKRDNHLIDKTSEKKRKRESKQRRKK